MCSEGKMFQLTRGSAKLAEVFSLLLRFRFLRKQSFHAERTSGRECSFSDVTVVTRPDENCLRRRSPPRRRRLLCSNLCYFHPSSTNWSNTFSDFHNKLFLLWYLLLIFTKRESSIVFVATEQVNVLECVHTLTLDSSATVNTPTPPMTTVSLFFHQSRFVEGHIQQTIAYRGPVDYAYFCCCWPHFNILNV